MKRFALFPLMALIFVSGQSVNAQNADSSEILVDAIHLDQVENPAELDRWRKIVDTQEVRAIGDAVTSYYGCVGCYSMVGTLSTPSNL